MRIEVTVSWQPSETSRAEQVDVTGYPFGVQVNHSRAVLLPPIVALIVGHAVRVLSKLEADRG